MSHTDTAKMRKCPPAPSDAERAEWPSEVREYVEWIEGQNDYLSDWHHRASPLIGTLDYYGCQEAREKAAPYRRNLDVLCVKRLLWLGVHPRDIGKDGMFNYPEAAIAQAMEERAAQGMAARSDETPQEAQPEGQQPGPQDAPTPFHQESNHE